MEPDILPTATHSTHLDWPAGPLLPEPSLMKQWAWRALRAAREEIHLAVESVMEDLEGLSASCSAPSEVHHSLEAAGGGRYSDTGDEEEVDLEAVLRVDDLVTPIPMRAGYEQELPEPMKSCKTDQGFEIIDFEAEACILAFR